MAIRPLRSIRARIACSFAMVLVLLCLVAAVALFSGKTVAQSFARYQNAQQTAQLASAAVEQAISLQLDVARYSRTEMVSDRNAARLALADLQAAMPPGIAGSAPDATFEIARLPGVMARVAAAISARRSAGAAVADAAISINTGLTAISELAVRLGLDEAAAIALRLQSAAQRCGLLALRFQETASQADVNAAVEEGTRVANGLDGLSALSSGQARLQRQVDEVRHASGLLSGAIDGLSVQTWLRTVGMADLDAAVGRIRAALDAERGAMDTAGRNAEQKLRLTLSRSATAVTGVAILAVALGFLCVVALDGACVRPLNALVRAVRRVAEGALETPVPHLRRTDEIGEVARAVLQLRDGALRTLLLEREAAAFAGTLALERQRLATGKADATEEALGGVARTIGRTAERLLIAADSLNEIAARTSRRAGSVVIGSEQSRNSAERVAAAAEQLLSSVGEMARHVTAVATARAVAMQDAGRTEGSVRSLSAAASGIQEATQLIASVAKRTKLLALNAAIEAAHAGEAGLGFRVVASEVKELATQTAAATERIACQMEAMRLAINEAVVTLDGIRTAIGSVSTVEGQVAAAVEEQHATMRSIVQAAGAAALATGEVAAAMQAVLADAAESVCSVDSLRGIAAEVSTQGSLLEGELEKVVTGLRAA